MYREKEKKKLESIEKWIKKSDKEKKEAEVTIKKLEKKVEEVKGKIVQSGADSRRRGVKEEDKEWSESENAECWQDVVLFCKKKDKSGREKRN